MWLMLVCGGASIAGHCFPVWFNFSGGKGAATTLGVLIVVAPAVLIPAAIVFFAVLVVTGFVGLATMSAAVMMPVWFAVTNLAGNQPTFLFLVLLALFIVYTHRVNIRRMRNGEESRWDRVMLLRR